MLDFIERRGTAGRVARIIESINAPAIELGSPAPEPEQKEFDGAPAALLTVREAAKVLGCCEKNLWSMSHRGEIPAVKIGRSVRYDPRDLSRWIARNKSSQDKSSAAL